MFANQKLNFERFNGIKKNYKKTKELYKYGWLTISLTLVFLSLKYPFILKIKHYHDVSLK